MVAGSRADIPPGKISTTGANVMVQPTSGAEALKIIGGNGLYQIVQVFDFFGNPIFTIPTAGGPAVFGDDFRVFAPGDIFNAVFKILGGTSSGLTATSGGFKSGHGAGEMAVFFGTGAPVIGGNPDTVAANGDVYVRKDGGTGSFLYQVRGGVWVNVL